MKILSFFILLIMSYSCSMTTKDKQIETKVYSELNKVIEDSFVVNKDRIYRMEMKIQGNIKGKGYLSCGHIYYVDKDSMFYAYSMPIELEGCVDKTIKDDWYDGVCKIYYCPEDSLVTGEISISYEVFCMTRSITSLFHKISII